MTVFRRVRLLKLSEQMRVIWEGGKEKCTRGIDCTLEVSSEIFILGSFSASQDPGCRMKSK